VSAVTTLFPVDVRIIATTNADLLRGIDEKRFRSDLYYRLNVIPIKIPPLRERNGDVDLLSEFFLTKYSHLNGRPKPHLAAEAIALLRAHSWPGKCPGIGKRYRTGRSPVRRR